MSDPVVHAMAHLVRSLTDPIMLLALGLIALTVRCARRCDRLTTIYAGLLMVIYLFVSTPYGANLLAFSLEGPPAIDPCPPDAGPWAAIVLLAGGYSNRDDNLVPVALLQEASFRRSIEATAVADANPDLKVVVSGGGDGGVTQAGLMSEVLLRFGISAERIVREDSARDTRESGLAVRELLGGPPEQAVILVTSALHMPRAAAVFRAQEFRVCEWPVDRRTIKPAAWEALIPQFSALRKSTEALHEIIGIFWYRLSGVT